MSRLMLSSPVSIRPVSSSSAMEVTGTERRRTMVTGAVVVMDTYRYPKKLQEGR